MYLLFLYFHVSNMFQWVKHVQPTYLHLWILWDPHKKRNESHRSHKDFQSDFEILRNQKILFLCTTCINRNLLPVCYSQNKCSTNFLCKSNFVPNNIMMPRCFSCNTVCFWSSQSAVFAGQRRPRLPGCAACSPVCTRSRCSAWTRCSSTSAPCPRDVGISSPGGPPEG